MERTNSDEGKETQPTQEETLERKPKEKFASDKYEEDDIANCPVLKDRFDSFTPEQKKEMKEKYDQIVKPMMQKKKLEEESKEENKAPQEEKKKKARTRHPRFEKYRESQGACPYMNTSIFLRFIIKIQS